MEFEQAQLLGFDRREILRFIFLLTAFSLIAASVWDYLGSLLRWSKSKSEAGAADPASFVLGGPFPRYRGILTTVFRDKPAGPTPTKWVLRSSLAVRLFFFWVVGACLVVLIDARQDSIAAGRYVGWDWSRYAANPYLLVFELFAALCVALMIYVVFFKKVRFDDDVLIWNSFPDITGLPFVTQEYRWKNLCRVDDYFYKVEFSFSPGGKVVLYKRQLSTGELKRFAEYQLEKNRFEAANKPSVYSHRGSKLF
ncbi:hypothetical protein [Tabrizicola sp.]|uniref:hypothetical protein n=1 Tax=Tabrizicola sp. TaxID=2005166 RepID=UPI003F3AE006